MTATPYPLPRETRESTILVGNGTVGPYAASLYKIFDTADVKVFAKALGETVYSDVTAGCTIAKVNPAAAYDYFTVTFGAAVPATTDWYHQARRTAERSVAVTRGGTLDSNQLEKELSKQATVESEVRRDLDRSAHFPRDYAGATELPAAEAGKFLGWDEAATKLVNKTVVDLGAIEVLDEDDMASNSPTAVPTQQSTKAYADTKLAKASNLSDLPSKPTARGNLLVPVLCADVAAVAALDITKDNKGAIIWNAGLRNGRLNWNSANLSAQVTADPNQYTYIAPASAPTGASGAWVYDSGLFVGQFPTPAIRSERSKMQDRADLRDWNGLDLAGVNDNAALVQAAINACAGAGGTKLNIPAGQITLGSTITVPQYANIEGAGNPATGFAGAPNTSKTFFHLAHLGVGFNLLGVSDGPRRIAGFGTYRDQTAPGVGWSPIGALADVQVAGTYDATVEDLFFYNATTALRVTGSLVASGAGNGRLTIRQLRGQALSAGLTMTHIYDTIFVDDIHWWPYWSRDTNVLAYTRANAYACILGRVDWPQFGRLFSWGMHDGVFIQNQASVGLDGILPAGTTTHLHIDSLNVDACRRGFTIEAAANLASYNIDNLTCTNDTYNSEAMVTIAGTNSRGYIGKLYGANTDGSLVTIAGSGNNLVIGASRSSGIDHDASGSAEFNVGTGTNRLDLATKPITSAGTVYAFAGTGRISSPDWINFTPTVSSSSGTITTVAAIAAGDCKYKLEGTTCTFDYTVTITTNGTGAGVVQMTLPFQAKKIDTANGKVAAVNIGGLIQSSVARVDVSKYDGTYPGSDGAVLRISGSYEIA